MMQQTDTSTTAPPPQAVSVPEAARRLGLTEAAVRQRLQRGTLPGVKVNGRIYVRLGPFQPAVEPAADTPLQLDTSVADETADTTGVATPSRPAGTMELHVVQLAMDGVAAAKDQVIDQLTREVVFLAEELTRRDTLIAELTQRLPLPEAKPAPLPPLPDWAPPVPALESAPLPQKQPRTKRRWWRW